jgi:hypothetical protein
MQIVVAEFPKRYGGNVRVMLRAAKDAGAAEARLKKIDAAEAGFGERLDQLAAKVGTWKTNKLDQLNAEVARHGPLAAKAFPGRAAIPIKMLGLSTDHVSAAYEKPGSAKVGNYIPGTRIPIRSDDDFSAGNSGGAPLLNMAWHIADEIKSYLRQRDYSGPIIDIISPDDFLKRG